jgi:hypothetical protein
MKGKKPVTKSDKKRIVAERQKRKNARGRQWIAA